jgi:hypothetical protein
MDLLGGYESSSSSTDGVEVEHARSVKGTSDVVKLGRDGESSRTTSTSTLPGPVGPFGVVGDDRGSALDSTTSSARPKDTQNLQKQQRVGKKILSLASVLPPHILEALTRATANSKNGTSSTNPYVDDSDDSGDDNDGAETKKRKTGDQSERANTGAGSSSSSSNEFSSFLADLQRAAPLHAGGCRSSTSKLLQPNHYHGESTSAARKPSSLAPPSTTMGDAFLATTFTTTTVKSAATVRDIHASSDEIDDGGASHSFRETAAPTRPLSSRICAAPVVGASTAVLQNDIGRQILAANQENGLEASIEPHPPQAQARSRKEMERALRRGQIDTVINDAALTSSIQGADPNNFSMEPPTIDPESTTHSMVRNVPTQLYDPSSGGLAAAASMRRGGKNQINQLLAQAAHLERERAQQPSQVAKIQRANAKRKYGW